MAHKTTIKRHSSTIISDKICGWVIPAVDSIVGEFPTEDLVDGFRVILTTDNKIYTYNESFDVWQLDTQTETLINGLGVAVYLGEDYFIYAYNEGVNGWLNITSECVVEEDVTSELNVEVGAIQPLDVVLEGTTLTGFVKQLLQKIYYPTLTTPNPTLTGGNNQEVGNSYTFTLTFNFSSSTQRGAISGTNSGGIWNPSLLQNYRTGAAIEYIIDGVSSGVNNSRSVTRSIIEGTNTFNGSVEHAIGPQPLDSKGNNYSTPYPAGTISKSRTISGQRNAFWESKVGSQPTTSAHIRALSNSLLNPQQWSSGSPTFTIDVNVGDTIVIFSYPATLRDVTSVLHREDSNAEIKTAFTKTESINVEGANGYTAIAYKTYYYIPDIPFISNEHFDVFI